MTESSKTLRVRIFAGPNGSGKSTVIKTVKDKKVNGRSIDFGYYVNADDIANSLKSGYFSFSEFNLNNISQESFISVALASGLVDKNFSDDKFLRSFSLEEDKFFQKDESSVDRLAQIIADFLRKQLLAEQSKFSFETVFSHEGKLDFMKEALQAGYKIYLYFVATESADINIARVQARVKKGGHNVPTDKILSRYERSLGLLYEASQMAYQAFFFDNSSEEQDASMFAHFKKRKGKKLWDKTLKNKQIPDWFIKYYSSKIPDR